MLLPCNLLVFLRKICVYKRTNGKTNLCEQKILFDQRKLKHREEEFTIMRVVVKVIKDGETKKIEYFLYNEYDASTNTSSMSRTTAYTCTAAVHILSNQMFNEKRCFPNLYDWKTPSMF